MSSTTAGLSEEQRIIRYWSYGEALSNRVEISKPSDDSVTNGNGMWDDENQLNRGCIIQRAGAHTSVALAMPYLKNKKLG